MAQDTNIVILEGNLVRDPELRYTQAGKAVARITVANNNDYNGKENTSFIDCTAWGKTAENVSKYLTKGSKVLVEGRLEIQTYDNKDGQRVYRANVVARAVKFLSPANGQKRDGNETGSTGGANTQQTTHSAPPADSNFAADPFSGGSSIDLSDDDLPF